MTPWDSGTWDSGETWDSDEISQSTAKKKKHTMPKKFYMPNDDAGKVSLLNQATDVLQDSSNGLAAKYNVTAAQLTALDHGRQWVNAWTPRLGALRDYLQSATAFKNALFNGSGALAAPVLAAFTAPAVDPVAGVFTLLAEIAQQIKNSPAYVVQDGELIGIEGAEIVLPPADSVSPDLSKTRPASGGFTEVVWKKGRFTAIKIMVDRHDGKGEVFLAVDTQPNYIDTVKPAAGATAVYAYRGIYLLGDEEFGQWSQPFEITVRG
jgi:hypothetical protein